MPGTAGHGGHCAQKPDGAVCRLRLCVQRQQRLAACRSNEWCRMGGLRAASSGHGRRRAHSKPAAAKCASAAAHLPQYSMRPHESRMRSSKRSQMSLLGWWIVHTICACAITTCQHYAAPRVGAHHPAMHLT